MTPRRYQGSRPPYMYSVFRYSTGSQCFQVPCCLQVGSPQVVSQWTSHTTPVPTQLGTRPQRASGGKLARLLQPLVDTRQLFPSTHLAFNVQPSRVALGSRTKRLNAREANSPSVAPRPPHFHSPAAILTTAIQTCPSSSSQRRPPARTKDLAAAMASSSARGNYSHPSLEDDDLIDPDDGSSPFRAWSMGYRRCCCEH